MISEKILYIAEVMNKHEYVPKMPNQSEIDLIFDTSNPDVQPYLFKVKNDLTYTIYDYMYQGISNYMTFVPHK